MVRNYTETVAENALRDELSHNAEKYRDMCQCSSCQAIILSTALNMLPPFYVSSKRGEVFGEYQDKNPQSHADVSMAIMHGINKLVETDPHSHE